MSFTGNPGMNAGLKTLYLDCASGISGDMTVAALLDLGADEEGLRGVLSSLPLDAYRIEISRVRKSGIDACDFNVILDEEHENHDHDMAYLHGALHPSLTQSGEEGHAHTHAHEDEHAHDHEHSHAHEDEHAHDHEHSHTHAHEHEHTHAHMHEHPDGHGPSHMDDHSHEHAHAHDHGHGHPHHGRNLDDIRQILYSGALNDRALGIALRIFEILAEAEAKVHGLGIDEVHFHEVGAVDSIVDIASIAYCIDDLDIGRVIIPVLNEGTGLVRCQHGLLPIPVPATSAIIAASHLPLRILPIEGELVTPTGAAAAAALCTDTQLPESFTIDRIGTGAGKRDYAVAGILRAMLISEPAPAGRSVPSSAGVSPVSEGSRDSHTSDTVLKMETNIDDSTGEALGFVMDQLFNAGALDVFFTPITMKKNRPAIMLSLLCSPERKADMEALLFRHTTCIGVRYCLMERTRLERETITVMTPLGEANVKVCYFENDVYCYPEHDSVAALSEASGLGYKEVCQAIKAAATLQSHSAFQSE